MTSRLDKHLKRREVEALTDRGLSASSRPRRKAMKFMRILAIARLWALSIAEAISSRNDCSAHFDGAPLGLTPLEKKKLCF